MVTERAPDHFPDAGEMVTDEMVEKAARAISGASRKAMKDEDADWLARAALAAVAPLIRAAALEEAKKVADQYAPAYHLEDAVYRSVGDDILALGDSQPPSHGV